MTNIKDGARSPLPWRINPHSIQIIKDANGVAVLKTQAISVGKAKEEARANSIHIVKCVNSHDDLVGALKYIKTTIKGLNTCNDADRAIIASCMRDISEALIKAGVTL